MLLLRQEQLNFFLVISRCTCNKGVRSRQEYIKLSSIANLWL